MENKIKTGELFTREYLGLFGGGQTTMPNPDRVLRRTGKSIDALRELKNDPHLWSCIQSRKSGLLALDWVLLPNGTDSERVKLLTEMLSNLDIQRIERDVMEAVLFGFQPFEIIWERDGSRFFPLDIVPRQQEWFTYNYSGRLMLKSTGRDMEEIPPMKILNVQHEASEANPYGHSLLSKCYWPVTFKNGAIKFWVNFSEKYGMPLIFGQYQRGTAAGEAERLAQELSEMSEDAVIVAPSDISIQFRDAVRSSSSHLFSDLIKFCNNEISKTILSQTLTTELDMGSYSAAQIHYKVRKEVILSDIRLVEYLFNILLKYIVELNFADGSYPKFKILVNESENTDRIDRDVKVAQSGQIRFTKQYWKNTYGFDEGDIE